MSFNPIIEVQPDELVTPIVGTWALQKYRLMGTYCDIFATSMRNKWNIVYIDLFAGSGYSKIKDTEKIIKSSSLIAMSIKYKFHKYIICEKDSEKFEALKSRVYSEFPDLDTVLINGDANADIDTILSNIPISSEKGTLIFCFVDPYSLNLDFNTIKTLGSKYKVDFLILLALGMDGNRNFELYLQDENDTIDKFLGSKTWRKEFSLSLDKNKYLFLSQKYDENMKAIGYEIPRDKQEIRSTTKNLPLYHLAFYSKHALGNAFWDKIKKYANYSPELF